MLSTAVHRTTGAFGFEKALGTPRRFHLWWGKSVDGKDSEFAPQKIKFSGKKVENRTLRRLGTASDFFYLVPQTIISGMSLGRVQASLRASSYNLSERDNKHTLRGFSSTPEGFPETKGSMGSQSIGAGGGACTGLKNERGRGRTLYPTEGGRAG